MEFNQSPKEMLFFVGNKISTLVEIYLGMCIFDYLFNQGKNIGVYFLSLLTVGVLFLLWGLYINWFKLRSIHINKDGFRLNEFGVDTFVRLPDYIGYKMGKSYSGKVEIIHKSGQEVYFNLYAFSKKKRKKIIDSLTNMNPQN